MPAAAAEVLIAPTALPEIRRLQIPDLDRHAGWFLPRFQKTFPHLNQRQAIGFLKNVIYDNEFLFLFQNNAVAMAQAMSAHGLDASTIIWERFVWVADPTDQDQLEQASHFYTEFLTWAKRKSVAIVHIEENTDVPHELIRSRVGRVLNTEQKFVKLG